MDLIRYFLRGNGWECRDPVLVKYEPRRRPERNSAYLTMLVAIQQLFTPVGKSCMYLFEDLHLQTYLVLRYTIIIPYSTVMIQRTHQK